MKKRRFADGGETDPDIEAANASDDPIAALNKSKRWTDTEPASDFGEGATSTKAVSSPSGGSADTAEKRATFKDSFAAARKAGDKTFEWNGKKYTTDVAGTKTTASPSAPKSTSAPKASSTAAADFQRADKASTKPKYQSLQDRAEDYAAKRKESGVGMYGSRKSTPEPRGITKIDKGSMEPSGMGSIRSKKPRGGEEYAKGGSVSSRADGIAQRGKTRGKIY